MKQEELDGEGESTDRGSRWVDTTVVLEEEIDEGYEPTEQGKALS